MREILTIYQEYTGAGYLTSLYLLALIYLWVSEKNSTVRSIFVYGSGILQILFFFPLFYYGYSLLDQGTYYRILWLLPMTITIAYAGCVLLSKYPAGSLGLGVLMIVLCGNYVYNSEYITVAENSYHIPDEVIEVCDMILPKEGEERVTGVFPDELIHFVRQYTTSIQMVYGRDYLAPDWKYGDHPLREAMNREKIQAFRVVTLANKANCHYIILKRDKEIIGNLKNFNVELVGETENYKVYRNGNINF